MCVKSTGKLRKIEDKSKCMVFLGYETKSEAYKFLDPTIFIMNINRNVIFEESKS